MTTTIETKLLISISIDAAQNQIIMKVIFVGLHYKEGMKALDSKTYTGRIIDMIIRQLGDVETEKANIFPTTYLPMPAERWDYSDQFKIDGNALYVGLGRIVNDHLQGCHHHLSVHHPGWVIRKGKYEIKKYIRFVYMEILKYLSEKAIKTKCVRCEADTISTRKNNVYCDNCINEWIHLE